MTWYIEKDGEAKLIPEEVLRYKIENDEISGNTLVVNEEIGNWVPVKETQLWKSIKKDGPVFTETDIPDSTSTLVNKPSRNWGEFAKGLAKFFVLFAIAMSAVMLSISFFGTHSSASKLKGTYIAHLDLADNAITFSQDGKFVRSSRTFGDWEEVSRGAYKLQGTQLILSSSDGKTWIFHYDKGTDTMQQQGMSGVYSKSS